MGSVRRTPKLTDGIRYFYIVSVYTMSIS